METGLTTRRARLGPVIVVLFLILLLGPPSAADDAARTRADEVASAHASEDEALLAELAESETPDPWIVVDELLRSGEAAAARAFAQRTQTGVRDPLARYIEGQAVRPYPTSFNEAYRRAQAFLDEGDVEGGLSLLRVPADLEVSVPAIHLLELRALALAQAPRREESETAYRDAAELARKVGWWRRALRNLNRAARQAYARGAIDAAMGHSRARLHLEVLHGSRTGEAQALGNLGVFLRMQGESKGALEVQKRALAIFEREKAPLSAARTVGNLGRIYEDLGDIPRALEAYLDATARMEALDNEPGIAINIHNVGTAYLRLGDYAMAWRALERALEIDRRLGDQRAIAADLLSVAVLQDELGRGDEALEAYEQVIAISRRQQDPRLEAHALRNLAVHLQKRGEFERARDMMEAVLRLHDRMGEGSEVAFALMNLAAITVSLGDVEKGLQLYQTALDREKARESLLHVPSILRGMAQVHAMRGDYEAARKSGERALDLAREGERREDTVAMLGVLAGIYAHMGRFERTVQSAREAARDVALLARGLSEAQGVSVRERLADVFETGLAGTLVHRDPEAAAFFLEAGRAGMLLESLGAGDALRMAVLPDALRQVEDDARRAEAGAARRLLQARDAGKLAAIRNARKELASAREALSEVRARIRREAKAATALLDPVPDGIDAMQGRLQKGEALVLYGSTSLMGIALVVTVEDVRLLPLAPLPRIAEACEAMHYERPEDPAPPAAVAALVKLVVEPLGLDEGTTRVLVSPDGVLSYAPFAMLFEGVEVAYVPSASVYGMLADGVRDGGTGVLALGDPDYSDVASAAVTTLRSGSGLRPLPATREEAHAVGTLVLLGRDATEARFRRALASRARWRAVHLACHGLVRSDRPLLSSLAITPSGDDDGFLTALDIFRLQVPADLVVLSACETARGRVVRGEGTVGLVSAFFLAGAPRVIASLWSVDDEATGALMKRFYELWNPGAGEEGLGAARALREAQAWVASHEKWRHPHYWAAWTLWGLPD